MARQAEHVSPQSDTEFGAQAFFRERLSDPETLASVRLCFFSAYSIWNWTQALNTCMQIPVLNHVERPSLLAPHALVRFRCMVQATLDPEYYMGYYLEANTSTGEKVSFCVH